MWWDGVGVVLGHGISDSIYTMKCVHVHGSLSPWEYEPAYNKELTGCRLLWSTICWAKKYPVITFYPFHEQITFQWSGVLTSLTVSWRKFSGRYPVLIELWRTRRVGDDQNTFVLLNKMYSNNPYLKMPNLTTWWYNTKWNRMDCWIVHFETENETPTNTYAHGITICLKTNVEYWTLRSIIFCMIVNLLNFVK